MSHWDLPFDCVVAWILTFFRAYSMLLRQVVNDGAAAEAKLLDNIYP
jgi:hypothetical protein